MLDYLTSILRVHQHIILGVENIQPKEDKGMFLPLLKA